MTISTPQSIEIFLGNGVTNTFNFTFVGVAAQDINVSYTDANGVISSLASSQYTLFLNPAATGALWGVGGTVTYPKTGDPIASGTAITVQRLLPFTQTTSISNQGDFYPQAIESALDTLEMQIQQVAARTGQFRGTWAANIDYNFGDYVIDGVNGSDTGDYYMCVIANTSTVWATDLGAGDWTLVISVVDITALVAEAQAAAATATTQSGIATTEAGVATTEAAAASSSASDAATSATAAAASAVTAASYATSLSSTSTTSVAIATGSKTFTTQAAKQYAAGQFLLVSSNASALNYMHGTVTSYSGTSLVMNITDIGGSGTHTDWNISVSGTQGPALSNSSQNANIVLAGPASGSPANPAFRALVTADLPLTSLLAIIYPVGSYYFNETDSTNPATLFGFGTWVAVQDKFIIGAGGSYTAGSTGGSATHTNTINEMANHTHTAPNTTNLGGNNGNWFYADWGGTSIDPSQPSNQVDSTGGATPYSILNPYIAAYIWKRTV